MPLIRFLLAMFGTFLVAFVLSTRLGPLPPLGYFLDPFGGFWQNAERPATAGDTLRVSAPALTRPVTVVYDRHRVPHVFAANDHDLYYAQGYVTARDRLWQMDFQTRAAAGRLSEVLGEVTFAYDRFQRRMGMVTGAERTLEAVAADPRSRQMLEAYTAGVNGWIDGLTPATYPFEFKLLDYAPTPWTTLRSVLMLKQMTANLTTGTDDLFMTRALQKWGRAAVDSLFPSVPYYADPIIPAGTTWDFAPLPTPPVPPDFAAGAVSYRFPFAPEPDNGSNNWAVGAARSATGYPLLANDPHLGLGLPSLWYQIQLHAPGVNVAGVSLPGTPAVIIGFNEQVAWGVTNVDADVLDFYRVDFADSTRRTYRHGTGTRPVQRVEERIRVRSQGVRVDTVLYTHHGPLVYDLPAEPSFSARIPAGLAMRWIAHEAGNEFLAFYLLNRATGYGDFTAALAHFTAPAQNFAYAGADGHVALWVQGRFPLKWQGQGRFILDGSQPAHDWQGWLPVPHNPHVADPPRGFVSSANQSSTDTTYPYYLNWEQAPYGRGARINERLEAMGNVTADSLRRLQNDNLYWHARQALPHMLPHVRTADLTAD